MNRMPNKLNQTWKAIPKKNQYKIFAFQLYFIKFKKIDLKKPERKWIGQNVWFNKRPKDLTKDKFHHGWVDLLQTFFKRIDVGRFIGKCRDSIKSERKRSFEFWEIIFSDQFERVPQLGWTWLSFQIETETLEKLPKWLINDPRGKAFGFSWTIIQNQFWSTRLVCNFQNLKHRIQ